LGELLGSMTPPALKDLFSDPANLSEVDEKVISL